jgi:hypothetical protein
VGPRIRGGPLGAGLPDILKHSPGFFIQMMKGLNVINGRVLQLINKSFVLGEMPSNTKKKKPWSAFRVSKTLG